MPLRDLLQRVNTCRLCEHELDPRPVVRLSSASKVLVIGQAPGSKVHASGVPWDDASGDHLRQWLDVDRDCFDNAVNFGILPMAFCYPGRGESADKPPPARCAQTWHQPLLDSLDHPVLKLVIGQYAQRRYLGKTRHRTLTETVRHFDSYGPALFPLPHPSWRSRSWMARNTWFEAEVLPALRRRVVLALAQEI